MHSPVKPKTARLIRDNEEAVIQVHIAFVLALSVAAFALWAWQIWRTVHLCSWQSASAVELLGLIRRDSGSGLIGVEPYTWWLFEGANLGIVLFALATMLNVGGGSLWGALSRRASDALSAEDHQEMAASGHEGLQDAPLVFWPTDLRVPFQRSMGGLSERLFGDPQYYRWRVAERFGNSQLLGGLEFYEPGTLRKHTKAYVYVSGDLRGHYFGPREVSLSVSVQFKRYSSVVLYQTNWSSELGPSLKAIKPVLKMVATQLDKCKAPNSVDTHFPFEWRGTHLSHLTVEALKPFRPAALVACGVLVTLAVIAFIGAAVVREPTDLSLGFYAIGFGSFCGLMVPLFIQDPDYLLRSTPKQATRGLAFMIMLGAAAALLVGWGLFELIPWLFDAMCLKK